MKTAFVCGDCCAKALANGYRRLPKEEAGEIAYGKSCELHPSRLTMQATNAIEVPNDYTTPRAETMVQVSAEEDAPQEIQMRIGPVTDLAARLLVAWSKGDDDVDDLKIGRSVDVARSLLTLTKGA
jgi:hypothetical protein